MADAISIPSEIKFKEMLSHTFPGFFLAFSIFMLIDYLSPYNLTTWAMSSLTAMISFAGFIFVMGTILGIIIDGIHHSFIEDDVFDNFTAIHKLKMPVERKLKEGNHDIFTRHFFFPKLGAGGGKAKELDDHLDEAYYRYSEFYSNIFISLTIFSIVSPFYIFEVLEMPWRACVSIGIASLLTACICLVSSYTSYKAYLQAQSSVICGFINELEKDSAFNGDEEIIGSQSSIYRYLLITIVFLIPVVVFLIPIGYIYLKEFPVWLSVVILLSIIIIIALSIIIVCRVDKYYISKDIFSGYCKKPGFEIEKILEDDLKAFLADLSKKCLSSKTREKAKCQIKNIDEIKNKLNEMIQKSNKTGQEPNKTKLPDLLKKPNLSENLSKSSSSALLSFISSLLICLIALLLVYTPVNLAVGPTCIKFGSSLFSMGKRITIYHNP